MKYRHFATSTPAFLPGFGLINCNARLYDPALGRFLMPDPLIQDPASTQNFNRYSYCLNNPLKYTDESGEYFILDSFIVGLLGGGWERAKIMAVNDAKIWLGLFNVDKNDNPLQAAWHLFLRFTWELPQTVAGLFVSHTFNTLRLYGGTESVDYIHGATVLRTRKDGFGGITIGSFINGDSDIKADDTNPLFQHEFGHVLQSREHGLIWPFSFGIPSIISAFSNSYEDHNKFYTEQDANARALRYFYKNNEEFRDADLYGKLDEKWHFDDNLINGYNLKLSYNDESNQSSLDNLI